MTKTTRMSALMSASGSPSTAIKSASMPGARAPIRSFRPMASALTDVAPMIASMAPCPPLPPPRDLPAVFRPMGARHGVRAHVDFEVLVTDGHLEHRVVERDAVLHELESSLVEIAIAEKTVLVLQIVLQEQAGLRL